MPPLSLYLTECCHVFCLGKTHCSSSPHGPSGLCPSCLQDDTLKRETRCLWWMLIHSTLRYLPQTETLIHVTFHVGESLCSERRRSSKRGYLQKTQFSPRPHLGVQRGPGILGSMMINYDVQKREKLLEKHRGV